MKPGTPHLSLLLLLSLMGTGFAAETEGRPAALSPTRAKSEAARLIREDVLAMKEKDGSQAKPAGPEKIETPPGENLLILERIVVKGNKPPEIPPPVRETEVQEFFRTGTILENRGPRFTRRLWVKGDKGLMFSISW